MSGVAVYALLVEDATRAGMCIIPHSIATAMGLRLAQPVLVKRAVSSEVHLCSVWCQDALFGASPMLPVVSNVAAVRVHPLVSCPLAAAAIMGASSLATATASPVDMLIAPKSSTHAATRIEFSCASNLSHHSLNRIRTTLTRRFVCAGCVVRIGDISLQIEQCTPAGLVEITRTTVFNQRTPHSLSQSLSKTETMREAALQLLQDRGSSAVAALAELLCTPILYPDLFRDLGIDPPKGILLHGPPGAGKTWAVRTVCERIGARVFVLDGPSVFGALAGDSEARIRDAFSEAQAAAAAAIPCVLFIDEIDALCPRRDDADPVSSRAVAQLLTLMDGLYSRGQVLVIGATNRPTAVDPALRRPGRFDREIELSVPTVEERYRLLIHHTNGMMLHDGVDLSRLATRCIGYVGSDIAALCREAAMLALQEHFASAHIVSSGKQPVCERHFEAAMRTIPASSRRGHLVEMQTLSFQDIGGLEDVKRRLLQAVVWPMQRADTMARLGLAAPRGVMLHGPPGCCKTTLVRAAASQANAAFFTVSGASVRSSYLGDTEAAIRQLFARARSNRPAIVFLDEIDALVGRRGNDAGAVDSIDNRLLATFLTEMDGVQTPQSGAGVLVVAATNRIDQLDDAILRPGRFDHVLFVPPPDADARLSILRVKTRVMPLCDSVDLAQLAERTVGFSGADLESLCREAALCALRENISSSQVTAQHMELALKSIRPSLSGLATDVEGLHSKSTWAS